MYRARLLYLIPTLSFLCTSAIKRFGSDQALEPRVFQPGDAFDHPFHGIAAGRKISQPFAALFMSDSSGVRVLLLPSVSGAWVFPSPFPNGYLPGLLGSPLPSPSLIFFFTSTGDKRGRGKGTRGEQKDSFFVRP